MKTQTILSLLCTAAFAIGIISCAPITIIVGDTQNPDNDSVEITATATPPGVEEATSTPSPTPVQSENNGQPEVALISVGPNPEDIPQGYNPLTGLPASDPSTLELPAVLISITNFPPSARPQAGLSFSPWVFEIYIAEGMTRYLATFYGEFPHTDQSNDGQNPDQQPAGADVGPVRSGRLPYVYIRDFFQDSCLIYAGATEEIRAKLRGCAMVFGSDSGNINSAMLDVTRMERIAEENKRPGDEFNYTGNLFSPQPAGQGSLANTINVYYSYLNQGQWKYDSSSGNYLK